jgi:hypothetical protein
MPARVDEAARKLIEQHGTRAVHVAVEQLNQSIDERDHPARDFWAQVVHAIHEFEGPKSRTVSKARTVRVHRKTR